jgi:hypothetical protein
VSISQLMFRTIKLVVASWNLERAGALHINVEPISGGFDLSKGDALRGGIIFDDKMVPFAQVTTFAHLLGDHNLAPTG